jgi:hypothetical protein
MRERRRTPILTVLALTFVALVVTPIAAVAASGLPATITMTPEHAGPGASIEVAGIDFPANAAVEIQLTTVEGAVYLGTATTADGGYFRESVVLPVDATAGTWELRAIGADGADGAVAVHPFQAGQAAVAAEGTTAEAATASAAATGNSTGDIIVMLVFAVLIAGVGGGIAYVYHQTKHGHEQPGMSVGEDPIWGGASDEPEPALASTDEPVWSTAHSET